LEKRIEGDKICQEKITVGGLTNKLGLVRFLKKRKKENA
jgi:hypothetical protein